MVFKKILFQNRYVELETPPLMEKSILNFHFDYLNPSLMFPKIVKENIVNINRKHDVLAFSKHRPRHRIAMFLSKTSPKHRIVKNW